MEALGLKETGLSRIIKAGYELLGLETFFTSGPKESHAWTMKKGCLAPQAAGVIHTDFEKGFIRAEVTGYQDFVNSGSYVAAREKGLTRLEGKDYIVQDGDIMVAGENFGCGSSREQAPSVLKALGVKAVIAKSFARIFYRNSINIGMPVIVSKELYDAVADGDSMELDLEKGIISANGREFSCTKLPAQMQAILDQGGLIASLNKED